MKRIALGCIAILISFLAGACDAPPSVPPDAPPGMPDDVPEEIQKPSPEDLEY